ncbi:hypothetical protein FWH30_02500 [Microgenomates group bacterium]|nr:hypothetical protein [Microgenomates group bacterium]
MKNFWERKLTILCCSLAVLVAILSMGRNRMVVVNNSGQIKGLSEEVAALERERQVAQMAFDLSTKDMAREKILRDVKYQQKEGEVAIEMRGFLREEARMNEEREEREITNWEKWRAVFML